MEREPIPRATAADGGSVGASLPPGASPAQRVRLAKLYSPGHATLATFLGSPLGGAAILAINYRRLEQPRQAMWAWILGALATAGLVALGFVLPESVPTSGLAIGAVIGMHQLAKHLQWDAYSRHTAAGGPVASGWSAAGIGLLSLVAVFVIVVAGAISTSFDTKLLGIYDSVDVGQGEVIYEKGATKDDARTVGKVLEEVGFFENPATVTVRLQGEVMVISFVVQDRVIGDAEIEEEFRRVGDLLCARLDGRPLQLRLMDDEYQVRRRLGSFPR